MNRRVPASLWGRALDCAEWSSLSGNAFYQLNECRKVIRWINNENVFWRSRTRRYRSHRVHSILNWLLGHRRRICECLALYQAHLWMSCAVPGVFVNDELLLAHKKLHQLLKEKDMCTGVYAWKLTLFCESRLYFRALAAILTEDLDICVLLWKSSSTQPSCQILVDLTTMRNHGWHLPYHPLQVRIFF